jgi:hypothetical protein
MHGVVALLAQWGTNSLYGMKRGGEDLYIKTCKLKIHVSVNIQVPLSICQRRQWVVSEMRK